MKKVSSWICFIESEATDIEISSAENIGNLSIIIVSSPNSSFSNGVDRVGSVRVLLLYLVRVSCQRLRLNECFGG
jgi:hypothetical protein